MQVTEKSTDGLKRTLEVVVGANELGERFSARLGEIKDTVRLKGFRQGKVPVAHLKRVYGRSVMAEVVQKAVEETSRKAIQDRKEKPALAPDIAFPEDKDEIARVMDGKADLAYTMSFEVLPPIPPPDYEKITLEKLVADVTDADVESATADLVQRNMTYEKAPDGHVAAEGDQLTLDFIGAIDGEPFDGGKGEGVEIVLGRGGFIPGFEDGLTGAAAGENRTVEATFPDSYPFPALAGKTASFDVTVKEVARPASGGADDAFAVSLGVENAEKLKEMVREKLAEEYEAVSRQRIKRDLLDALDKTNAFELPPSLVDHEFRAIWRQFEASMKREGASFPTEEGQPEEQAREEYRQIAERRVRLGLVIGDIGEKNGIEVSQDELRRALIAQARRFPGQEKAVYEYFEKTPGALVELRAPIFEDKVVDLVLGRVKPAERKVDKDELFRPVEAPPKA